MAYYLEQKKLIGKDNTRFQVRGKIDREEVDRALADKGSFPSLIYNGLKAMLRQRNKTNIFGSGLHARGSEPAGSAPDSRSPGAG